MPADEVLPPEAYAWWVPALGAALLLAVALWYAFVLWRTRREADRPPRGRTVDPTVRQRYEDEVEACYRRYRTGELDLRSLHLELARTMREFASHRLGTDVRSWTRAEIAGHDRTSRVGELLAEWEQPSFAVRSDAEAAASAEHAREVVRSW